MCTRNRTFPNIIVYGLYLYFLGLSFRNTAKALSFLLLVKVSHVSIWNWLQKYRPWKHLQNKKIKEYIIDETVIKAGAESIWLWIAIEPIHKEIISFYISKKRKYICSKAISFHGYKQVWKACSFNRWWYLVPTNLQVFESISSSPFHL